MEENIILPVVAFVSSGAFAHGAVVAKDVKLPTQTRLSSQKK